MFDINSNNSKRGGARQGAGRKKGVVSKARLAVQERAKLAASEAETPLEYMLKILRDPSTDDKRRDAMAIAAAPYVHAKLASVEMKAEVAVSHEDALEQLN
jgi:hypothetical protein